MSNPSFSLLDEEPPFNRTDVEFSLVPGENRPYNQAQIPQPESSSSFPPPSPAHQSSQRYEAGVEAEDAWAGFRKRNQDQKLWGAPIPEVSLGLLSDGGSKLDASGRDLIADLVASCLRSLSVLVKDECKKWVRREWKRDGGIVRFGAELKES